MYRIWRLQRRNGCDLRQVIRAERFRRAATGVRDRVQHKMCVVVADGRDRGYFPDAAWGGDLLVQVEFCVDGHNFFLFLRLSVLTFSFAVVSFALAASQ